MDRAPGLSVRLKLTLSYAGFLMVAGALLLAVVWVFLLRYVPDVRAPRPAAGRSSSRPAPTSCAPSPRRQRSALAFLLVFGLVGGWLLAGRMLAPLTRITDATRIGRDRIARPTGSGSRAATTSSASSPTPSTPCSRGSKHTSPNSSDSPPTPPTNCAPRWRSRRPCSRSPATTRTATPTSSSTASTIVNARAIDLTEALLLLSRADQRSFAREHVDLSLAGGGSRRDAPPPRRAAWRHHRDLRRHDPHHRLTRAPAADDHEPRAQRDRPQPSRTRHRAGHDQPSDPGAWCSPSRTPARRSVLSWSRHSPSRSSAAPNAYARDHAGVGLGLAIVKSITQAHDGTLTLTPRPDGGLRVTVQLPAPPGPSD